VMFSKSSLSLVGMNMPVVDKNFAQRILFDPKSVLSFYLSYLFITTTGDGGNSQAESSNQQHSANQLPWC
jgi:hypothetical protein